MSGTLKEIKIALFPFRDRFVSDQQLASKPAFKQQQEALNAIIIFRTETRGEIQVYCPECNEIEWFAHSCGHRSCPKCQNHENSLWLERQTKKLLPVDYFLVTFTLPAELRGTAYFHQKKVYELLFQSLADALRELALNPKRLGGLIGLTGVLHTNSRRLDYHPHVHYILPGIAFDPEKRILIRSRPNFFIHGNPLGRLYKKKFLFGLKALEIRFNKALSKKGWVVDTEAVGKGEPALKYLSRYLYRGVISEKNILRYQNEQVTFQYTNSKTKATETRILSGYKFVKLILQHVLPKGFRRVRDFGFLHGKAKKTLNRLQLLLIAKISDKAVFEKPTFRCKKCGKPMQIIAVKVYRFKTEKRSRSPPKVLIPVP